MKIHVVILKVQNIGDADSYPTDLGCKPRKQKIT